MEFIFSEVIAGTIILPTRCLGSTINGAGRVANGTEACQTRVLSTSRILGKQGLNKILSATQKHFMLLCNRKVNHRYVGESHMYKIKRKWSRVQSATDFGWL